MWACVLCSFSVFSKLMSWFEHVKLGHNWSMPSYLPPPRSYIINDFFHDAKPHSVFRSEHKFNALNQNYGPPIRHWWLSPILEFIRTHRSTIITDYVPTWRNVSRGNVCQGNSHSTIIFCRQKLNMFLFLFLWFWLIFCRLHFYFFGNVWKLKKDLSL